MIHPFFNAKIMNSISVVTPRAIRRDIRAIKELIKYNAMAGRDYMEVSSTDSEWRTRFYWECYFTDRGFVVEHLSKAFGDCVRIWWSK